MRKILGLLFLALAGSCTDNQSPAVDRIDIRLSGRSAADITLNSRGEGRYHLSHPHPDGKKGSFSVKAQQVEKFQQQLQQFRRAAVTFSEQSAREFTLYECPEGVPFVTDAGGVYIRWVGPKSDQHYLADLGCDPERNASRNEKLLAVVESLPVPLR